MSNRKIAAYTDETVGIFFYVGDEGIFFRFADRTVEPAKLHVSWVNKQSPEIDQRLYNTLDFSREDLGWRWTNG